MYLIPSFLKIIDEVIYENWPQYQALGNISGLAIESWGKEGINNASASSSSFFMFLLFPSTSEKDGDSL